MGGTFDPPHVGHLIVAQDALTALDLDLLLLVPAAVPPHKQNLVSTPAALRLALLEAAVGDDTRIAVDDLEIRRSGVSYTVDTVRELQARTPDAELFLLLGMDQLREFRTWRSPAEILGCATVVGLSRAGDEAPVLDFPYQPLSVTRIDISATEIRRRVAAGLPIRYLVPAAVEALIERAALYRAPAPSGRAEV
jgi:nicotinate-nucleotide adenylyltransferase